MECEFSARERSSEEADELQRSTKKVKDASMGSVFGATISYKDKLVGEMPGAIAQAFNLNSDEDISDEPSLEVEGLHEGLLAVKLSPDMRKKIRAKWAFAIIVKVVGRTVGFHFLRNRVMSLWKPAGRLDCVDLGKDFFLMRFGLVEDYNNVLNGGPWFIGDHFLSIRRWEPNFKPTQASCSLVAVWIRLPELPFEYYELAVLKEIGNAIGPVLRIDSNTASEARGRYARICVQVDLCQPLINQILLEGLVQEIQYEGVRSLCFSCGRVGHRKDGCPHTIKAPSMAGQVEVEVGPVAAASLNRENGCTVEDDQTSHEAGTALEEGKSVFGPWMLVRKRNPKAGNARYSAQGPSPLVRPVSTSGAYAQSFQSAPDRPAQGMALGNAGSSRSMGKGVKASVGSSQGAVPSTLGPVESPQHLTQPDSAVHQSHLPSFEFGSGKFLSTCSVDGKAPNVGKGAKAKSKTDGFIDADRRGNNHGGRARAPLRVVPARETANLVAINAGTINSQSELDLGLVQQRRDGGLDDHHSGDTNQQPRGQDFQVASSIAAISGVKLERIKSGGRHHGRESLDCHDRGSAVLGKREFHGSGLSRSSDFQLPGQLKGATNGDSRIFVEHSGRGEITQETCEGDGMEVSAPVGDPVSA